jgi:small subunit ribosomal protein S20
MGGRARLEASWGGHGTEANWRISERLRPDYCFPLASDRPHRQNSRLFFGVSPPVANIKSAEKRARQTVKRRARNVAARSKLRTAIKNVVNAVNAGNKEEAAAKLKEAGPVIDSAVNKGVIHRNKASRHKSHLNARIKEMSAG